MLTWSWQPRRDDIPVGVIQVSLRSVAGGCALLPSSPRKEVHAQSRPRSWPSPRCAPLAPRRAASEISGNGSTVTYTAASGEANSVLVSVVPLRHVLWQRRRPMPVGLRTAARISPKMSGGCELISQRPDRRRQRRLLGPEPRSWPTSATATTHTGTGTVPAPWTPGTATTTRSFGTGGNDVDPRRDRQRRAATARRATTRSTAARATTTWRASRCGRGRVHARTARTGTVGGGGNDSITYEGRTRGPRR